MAEVIKTELYCEIHVDLFAAMKNILFEKHNARNLQELIQSHAADSRLGIDVDIEPWVEPNHPEWFDDFQAQPLSLAFWGLRFESSQWKKFFKMALAAPTVDPARPPELYCETNSSTQVTLAFDLRHAKTPEPELFPLGFETSRKLALLVLAFEGEIDKLLADHRGYITHSASALSNSSNPTLAPLAPKAKLHRVWKSCATVQDLVATMCPGAGSANYPDYPKFRSQYKYNLGPLLDTSHPHVEFRQHHGTLDAREIIHWVVFTGNLVQLARHIEEPQLLRLVHYADRDPVSLTELFLMMLSWRAMTPELRAMMHYYSRKSMARGASQGARPNLHLGPKAAGARAMVWNHLRPEQRLDV